MNFIEESQKRFRQEFPGLNISEIGNDRTDRMSFFLSQELTLLIEKCVGELEGIKYPAWTDNGACHNVNKGISMAQEKIKGLIHK